MFTSTNLPSHEQIAFTRPELEVGVRVSRCGRSPPGTFSETGKRTITRGNDPVPRFPISILYPRGVGGRRRKVKGSEDLFLTIPVDPSCTRRMWTPPCFVLVHFDPLVFSPSGLRDWVDPLERHDTVPHLRGTRVSKFSVSYR